MTRINTNVSSLVAQNTLGRSNASLNEALTRLSTGLRINTGKDDPAGLIASENLRSDITSIRRAISNTDRANQVIATADSALGQVSSLLNDIRGLVTESANTGVISDEQLDANQLQINSSLDALNRISQTTTFQGRRLLDGSLDFITTEGTNFSNVNNLNIDQANLGATGSVSVDINVSTAATQAVVQVDNIPAATTPVLASDGEVDFQTAEAQATGDFTVAAGGSDTITVTAVAGTAAAGAAGNDIDIVINDNNGTANGVDSIDFSNGVITIEADVTGGIGSDDIAAAIDGLAEFTASSDNTNDLVAGDATTNTDVTSGGVDEVDATITISPNAAGAFNRTINFTSNTDEGAGVVNVTDNGTTLTIAADDDTAVNLSDIVTAIEAELGTDDFTVTLADNAGDGQFNTTEDTAPSVTDIGAGTAGVGAGGLANDIVIELAGADGSEVLSFGAGTTIDQLVDGINLVSDSTGVTATINGTTPTTLDLTSSDYGSNAFVDLAVEEDASGVFTNSRVEGTDIEATVNGISVTGDGNDLTMNTSTLKLNTSMEADFTGTASFTITGGGALFQLGPDVVSNQQARLGIGSVNTARLGGVTGKLFQLGTGGSASLTSGDLDTAAGIVEEAIDQITSLRGRLGAFQRTTLETNKNALNDTLVNLTEAESSIRDADFAAESAALTRAQILVQSGTTVLQISNQNPQNALALLR